jgi:hypothetical protein
MSGQNILVFIIIGGVIAAFIYVNIVLSKHNKK